MYAIIENGNKQYKVSEGDVVKVERRKNGKRSCFGESDRKSAGARQVQKDHRL